MAKTNIEFYRDYRSEEERFEDLQKIEIWIQSLTKDPDEQAKKRHELVQKNPDRFYKLYKDYELSPDRKAELEMLCQQCVDRLSLNHEMMYRLVNFQQCNMGEKIKLCQDVITYLIRNSNITAFHRDFMSRLNVVVKPMEGLNGYRLGNEIGINQNNLDLSGNMAGIFDTLMHETLHAHQKKGQANFTELSHLYYVDPLPLEKDEKWKEKARPAYYGQPIEREAKFFGNLAGKIMDKNYETAMQKFPSIIQRCIETVTRESCSPEDSKKYHQDDNGKFIIPLPGGIGPKYIDATLVQFFGPGVMKGSEGTSARPNYYLAFKIGQNETAEQFMQRISDGTAKIIEANRNIEQFQEKFQRIFPNAKVVASPRDALILEGANPEIQRWIQSMGTNVEPKLLSNGNLRIPLPLILEKDGKETSYEQAFQERYITMLSPNGLNVRVLAGGDGKPIIPDTLRQQMSAEYPNPSNSDILRGAANGGQGQGGEPPMDKHNGLDYRNVGGKDHQAETPNNPTNPLEDLRERRRREIAEQFGRPLDIKRGLSM